MTNLAAFVVCAYCQVPAPIANIAKMAKDPAQGIAKEANEFAGIVDAIETL